MSIDLIKENILSEHVLGENIANTMVKEEYIIPDTLPDIIEIISLNASPKIKSREVMRDKVYIEGEVIYNLLYKGKVDENFSIYSANYKGVFKDYVQLDNAEQGMEVNAAINIEHIKPNIINERKIGIECIFNIKVLVFDQVNYKILKNISGRDDIQVLKTSFSDEKIIVRSEEDMVGKLHIDIPQDKVEAGEILAYNTFIHDRNLILEDNKIKLSCKVRYDVVYKEKDGNEIASVSDDMLLSKEVDAPNVTSEMEGEAKYSIIDIDQAIKEDDLGERRSIDIEVLAKAEFKVNSKETIDILQDAYSKGSIIEVSKEEYEINVLMAKAKNETIVRSSIDVDEEELKPSHILFSKGDISSQEVKVLEDKVLAEGVINVKMLYRTDNKEYILKSLQQDIPFSAGIDIKGAKIDMEAALNSCINVLDVSYEKGSIKIKAIVNMEVSLYSKIKKEFAVDLNEDEGQLPEKKASFIIYTVQKGDTLWKIAKKYFASVEEIQDVNEISDSSKLNIGEKLIIPGRAII
ncbi:MAG: SPOCS domain-containing protein [Clostridiaceae bacterium]